ncbi:hypothetical protein [uncultured phage MedDCM-OCT-S01-C58]|nr:hypothetical protein [uncultured phage MedDCM-OCT-S01-C58]BAR24300.1 Endo-N-acetylneuraminidase [uncultured Mediterranean phage uvMED]
MAQADGSCANASGSAFRADLNTQLAAVFTNHSGATAPATTFAYQFWVDTSTNELKIRNSSNSDWVTLRSVATGGITFDAGSITAPSLTFGTDGPDYGFYRYGLGEVAYVTQLSGADHTLFTIGKDVGDGPCLYWGAQVTGTSSADNAANTSTLEGLQVQRRGRINVCFNGGPAAKFNRIGSGGTELGSVVQFHSNGSSAGRIGIISASDVSLIDASDRRLKDNITDMPEAKSRINQIQMHRFRMISADSYEEGFIAQELKEVVPSAVMGSETDVDDEGNVEYMGVGKDMLVPLLMKGLQEAYAEITALTARVEALEAG